MKGCLQWVFLGFIFIIFKIFAASARALWMSALAILELVSGRPLYYCELRYLIPAKILGVAGLGIAALSIIGAIASRTVGNDAASIWGFLVGIAIGLGLLWGSRILIRRGSF